VRKPDFSGRLLPLFAISSAKLTRQIQWTDSARKRTARQCAACASRRKSL